jgi:DOMON domain/Copper type II ascorbate-dependent monooxygenase, C-terminal domain/Copper type II ascorbate-dependent monooxygenase, N-terminal domain
MMMQGKMMRALPFSYLRCAVHFIAVLSLLLFIPEEVESRGENYWLEDEVLSEVALRYNHFVALPVTSLPSATDANDGMAIFWSIIDDTEIQLAVAARIDDNGWIGFGLVEAGGMPGADMFVYHAWNDSVVDMYATAYDTPHVDADQQDWIFVNSSKGRSENGWVTCEVKRLLDTGDPRHDRGILDSHGPEPHRVIGAWGHDGWGYHGPHQRVRGSVHFFTDNQYSQSSHSLLFRDAMAAQANHVLQIINSNFTIPVETTTNVKFCFTLSQDFPELTSSSDGFEALLLHGIGIEPIISSSQHVHHMVLTGSTIDYGNVPRTGYDCDHLFDDDGDAVSAIQGWAAGQGPVQVPPQAGIPLAGGGLYDPSGTEGSSDEFGGYKSFQLYIHYDNRFHIPNAKDAGSGFKIYATNSLRQYPMGFFVVGHGNINGVAVGSDDEGESEILRYHEFTCPSACTESILSPPISTTQAKTAAQIASPQEMVVVAELLHMHETGTRMVNRVLDKNGTIKHEGWIDYWDATQSGLFPTSSTSSRSSTPFTLAAGDFIETRCYFDATKSTREDTQVTNWGDGSQDEMCQVFLWYYPRQPKAISCGYGIRQRACSATHVSERLDHEEQLERVFGNTPPLLPSTEVPDRVATEPSNTPTRNPSASLGANNAPSTGTPSSTTAAETTLYILFIVGCLVLVVITHILLQACRQERVAKTVVKATDRDWCQSVGSAITKEVSQRPASIQTLVSDEVWC